MSQVSYKERTKTTMVTKNWTSKVGLSRFPNNAHEAFLITKGEISQENISTFKKKMNVANLFSVYPRDQAQSEFSVTYMQSSPHLIIFEVIDLSMAETFYQLIRFVPQQMKQTNCFFSLWKCFSTCF
jgi:hypothetical protein